MKTVEGLLVRGSSRIVEGCGRWLVVPLLVGGITNAARLQRQQRELEAEQRELHKLRAQVRALSGAKTAVRG